MNPRTKNLAIAGAAAALVGIVGVNVLMSPAARPPAEPDFGREGSPAGRMAPLAAPSGSTFASPEAELLSEAAAPSPASSPLAGSAARASVALDSGRRSYAIGLQELRGLPPDAAPGTAFELWVTWEPPVTKEPRLHRLIGDVVLERVIPGAVPEAPITALVSVPADRTGDLIYADTFGGLNVVLPD